jgi:signal transduction histidine kinase
MMAARGRVDRSVAAVRSLTGSLSRQFALTVSLSVAPVLAGLIVVGLLMVISGHAVVLTCAIVVGAGVLALVGSQLFSRQLLRDLEAIRCGLEAVRSGDREVAITTAADDELRGLAAAATAMIEQLAIEERARAQSDAARRDLVAAVSHDLRTPITSLQLLAEAIGDDIIDASQRQAYVDRMSTHVAALSALIDDLFELSRLEAGDIDWSLEQVALGELVGETVEAMRVHAEAKRVRVMTSLSGTLDPARANPEKLQRVLFNLIQNAIRHTPADGSVVIHAEPTATGIEIEVTDDGEGIDPAERERVFASFYRAGDRASRTDSGAGLGLAVARAIVEAHGGRIWIADSEIGTRVRFSLPTDAAAQARG